MIRLAALTLCLCLGLSLSSAVRAAPGAEEAGEEAGDELAQTMLSSPYSVEVRQHFYSLLSRSPAKAFLWELALPGAGHVYAGFPIQAGVAAGLSCVGAALWIAGAVRDQAPLWWAGAGTFAAGRLYGLISAPVSAALLNAAYRRQLGITGRF